MREFFNFIRMIENSLDERATAMLLELNLYDVLNEGDLSVGDDVVFQHSSGKIHGTIKSIDGDNVELESDKGEKVNASLSELKKDEKFYDGYWVEPLPTREEIKSGSKNLAGTYAYRFNVLGDGCGSDQNHKNPCACHKEPGKPSTCYVVKISGDPNFPVSIAFYRGGKVSDMKLTRKVIKTKNDGSKEEISLPVGPGVFAAVQKAVGEYVKKLKPIAMSWMPVTRSDVEGTIRKAKIARTPEQQSKFFQATNMARKNVYETWSVKNFFPELYVNVGNSWITRQSYDDNFVTAGFPPVPTTVMIPKRDKEGNFVLDSEGKKEYKPVPVTQESDSFVKFKAFEELNDKIKLISDYRSKSREIFERMTARQTRRSEEDSTQSGFRRGDELAARSNVNPQDIQKDSIVRLRDDYDLQNSIFSNYPFKCFKVKHFYSPIDRNVLYVQLIPQRNPESEEFGVDFTQQPGMIPIDNLVKLDSVRSHIKWYKNKIKEQKNVEGIKYDIGDNVEGKINPRRPTEIYSGKVKSFSLGLSLEGRTELMVILDWDEETMMYLNPRQDKPIRANLLKKKGRGEEIDRTIEKQKQAEIKIETPSNLDVILVHPMNREKLKPGDHFKASHYKIGENKKGVITNMIIRGNILYAVLRVLNAKSGPGVESSVELPITYIQRDKTASASQAREKLERGQQRQQEIESASMGFKVGDKVFVSGSGQYSGKNGRIVSLKMSRGVVNAVVAPEDGPDFSVKLSSLIKVMTNTHATTPMENTFKHFFSSKI